MNKPGYTPMYLRKRKMLLVLPLLVLPFFTLGFWALGGGKATFTSPKVTVSREGLNLQLPDAHLKKDKGLDKMSYYEMAAADSGKLKASIRNDPYFALSNNAVTDTDLLTDKTVKDKTVSIGKNGMHTYADLNQQDVTTSETKVYDKLKQINEVLKAGTASTNLSQRPFSKDDAQADYVHPNKLDVSSNATDRLENMMQQMKEGSGNDSEINQINAMLEKVMDIQHPERLNEKYKQLRDGTKKTVLQVTGKDENNTGFFSGDNEDSAASTGNSFPAVICDQQTLVNGAIVKLRLLSDVHVNGKLIPKDKFVFGKVSLNGERLIVSVGSIVNQNNVFPVAMSVFDVDGIEGIYIPGAITRDVAKQSADNALQSVALNSLDPSIGAQAAGAGIETVKTLISKKVKLVKVTVKAGYHVFLKNNDAN